MNKPRIITLITFILLASFITEANAQGTYLEINVKNTKVLSSKYKITHLPSVGKRITQEEILIEQQKVMQESQKKAIETQASSAKVDTRSDFTSIYMAAGSRYGLDWRILAAVHKVETGQSGNTQKSSYAGAQGPMQFMPSTFKAYAVDGDNDGNKNIYDVDDAIFSAANYISANASGKSIDAGLFRYNHSTTYVQKVKSIAYAL